MIAYLRHIQAEYSIDPFSMGLLLALPFGAALLVLLWAAVTGPERDREREAAEFERRWLAAGQAVQDLQRRRREETQNRGAARLRP